MKTPIKSCDDCLHSQGKGQFANCKMSRDGYYCSVERLGSCGHRARHFVPADPAARQLSSLSLWRRIGLVVQILLRPRHVEWGWYVMSEEDALDAETVYEVGSWKQD